MGVKKTSATPKAAPKATPKKAKASAAKAAPKAKSVADGVEAKGKAAGTKKASALVAAPAASVKALDALEVPQVFPIDALDGLRTPTQAGQVFRLDGGFLDALRLQLRRVQDADGKAGLRLSFKISGPSRKDFGDRLTKKKAKREVFGYPEAKVQKKGKDLALVYTGTNHPLTNNFYSHKAPGTGAKANEALVLQGKGWRLEYVPNDGPKALRGNVRIELRGSEAEQKKALEQAIQQAGLQPIFAPPNETSIRRYALMKLLWRTDPAAAKKLSGKGVLSDLKISAVEAALKKAGVSLERMDGLRYEEVAPGHFTVMDPANLEEMEAKGLRYAYSTVTMPEHVLSILEHGQKATLTRWAEGMLISGMSSMSDVGSGGAEGVFSRIVTTAAKDNGWTGRTYKIILKPELFQRMDIWGWQGDYYGRSWDLTKDNFGPELIDKIQASGYASYNEIISPVGNDPRFIGAVVATDENSRKKLIAHLKSKKYKPPGGQSLEAFVRLSPKIDPGLLSKKPAAKKKAKKAPTKKVA